LQYFGGISTWFAFDRNIALEGCWGRYEGLYSILYYLSVMLLSSFVSDKYKKVLVNAILLCGMFQAVYGIFQSYGLFNVKQFFNATAYYDETINKMVYGKEIWITGFTNNPNFFGTYMLLCLTYSLGLFLDCKKTITGIVYTIYSALFLFALLLSNTTSAAVGLIVVMCFVTVYCIKNKMSLKFLTILAIICSITSYAYCNKKTTLVKDVIKVGNEGSQITKGNFDESYGTRRMFIWKETFKIVPNHFWHGVGVDSFHKAFNGTALVRKTKTRKVLYDKAHNEYLQILVTQGIFALIAYLLLYGYAMFCGLKRSFKYNEVYVFLPVIGYLVQALFNISVIEVAPFFFIALGLCCSRKTEVRDKEKKVVLTYGTFDLLHYGHLRLFERAKKLGDYLIVAVSTDAFNELKGKKSFYSYEIRKEMVESLKCVDLVIPEETWEQKIDDIKKYNVSVVTMGSDWKDSEKFEVLRDYCDVVYLDRTDGISTTKIIDTKGGMC
jgi:glycerol-3-phosphate cytidylyltransferase